MSATVIESERKNEREKKTKQIGNERLKVREGERADSSGIRNREA